MSKFKQFLFREGRGYRVKGGTVKGNSEVLRQCLGSPSKDILNNIFELFCRYWNPHQVGEVNCIYCQLKPEGWWCWLPLASPPVNQKNAHELIMPSLNHCYKNPCFPLQVGTDRFEGIILLCPPLPAKAVKLFFSTSLKTLSLRFNSVSRYRGWIHLRCFIFLFPCGWHSLLPPCITENMGNHCFLVCVFWI